jgi:hypothetical protein
MGIWAMKCEWCEGEISEEARACKHCGRITAQGKAEKNTKTIGCFAIGLISVFVIFIILVLIGSNSKPVTYRDLADQKAEDCVRHKGYGQWYASSGLTLQEFCKGVGSLDALEQERRDHPERY